MEAWTMLCLVQILLIDAATNLHIQA
jgi:hypothetical protein